MRLQTSSVVSVQEKPGEEICQSATYIHNNLNTYVHVCESGVNAEGKPCMHACISLVLSFRCMHIIDLVYMHICYTPYVSLTKINILTM